MSIFDEYNGDVKFDSSKKPSKGTFNGGGTFTGGGKGGKSGKGGKGGTGLSTATHKNKPSLWERLREGRQNRPRGSSRRGGGFLSNLPELWWVDLIGIVLTAAGLIAIGLNFDTVCLAILTVIYNLLSILGVILLIVGIVIVVGFMLGRRRLF